MSRGVDREPCPYRIVDDAGNAFLFGFVGGSIWHFCGGLRNAPANKKLELAWSRVSTRAPILGGSFAVWGTLFSACDCTLTHFRKKEDPWNAIFAGALTGGILASRAGPKAAGKNAVIGGVILALIEGVSIGVQRVLLPMYEKQAIEQGMTIDMLDPPVDPMMQHAPLSNTRDFHTPVFSGGATSTGGGFDLNSVSNFDSRGDDWGRTTAAEESSRVSDESKGKSSWWPF
mmetsp:Transcript_15335/g.23091  ORF Transcript_15335/g.23091 Transcript_15335/m.23091 type:complete len:230 (-) Transcript_15335:204-893(-)|eukprot:CAMPEP_0185025864 /NCGR_PEP_ID=MMETSP1103-20130426/9423_1 /TAXON_ID=36769 /ORGANISM="Paraphysomonas bandaiensis, Strain Caron Lab Isolate" /LENGTH=229 /DNA_ID=CAMNT_0027559237 /DNA_START=74 /DNA_END=763 /DNA_ORIENTATION=+